MSRYVLNPTCFSFPSWLAVSSGAPPSSSSTLHCCPSILSFPRHQHESFKRSSSSSSSSFKVVTCVGHEKRWLTLDWKISRAVKCVIYWQIRTYSIHVHVLGFLNILPVASSLAVPVTCCASYLKAQCVFSNWKVSLVQYLYFLNTSVST